MFRIIFQGCIKQKKLLIQAEHINCVYISMHWYEGCN